MLRKYRLSPVCLALLVSFYHSEVFSEALSNPPSSVVNSPITQSGNDNGSADYVEFNDQLMMSGEKIDIKRYALGNPALPGEHDINIFVNNEKILSTRVNFIDDGKGSANACLTSRLLIQAGLSIDKMSKDLSDTEDAKNAPCIMLQELIPQARVHFDNGEQRLDLSIPQKYIKKVPKDYVDPVLWESGINAAILSYDLNAYHSYNQHTTSDSIYNGVMYGFNLGEWHFRSRGAFNWNSDEKVNYTGQYSYLQRDISALQSQLILGESNTRGDYFDSLDIIGVRLYNDDRMLPGSVSGYAPVIHGIAKSNAKVTVRQSGNIISQSTVPPGPFDITDLNTTGFGNNLEVSVQESDGSEQHFSVPFSSVSQLLREDYNRWEFSAGKLNQGGLHDDPHVMLGTYAQGINSLFTGYTGVESSDNGYLAGLLGVAMNTSAGAVAFDITQSKMDLPKSTNWSGQSYRLSYSKMLEASQTSVNVAAWRNSTRHYLSLSDAESLRDEQLHEQDEDSGQYNHWQIKNQFQLNINQTLAFNGKDYGSFYVSSSWQTYWQSSDKNTQYSAGYSNEFRWGNYSITAQRSYNNDNNKDDRIYVNVSIPLSIFAHDGRNPAGFTNLNSGYSSDLHGNDQLDVSASGNSDDGHYNYSLNSSYQTMANSGQDNSDQKLASIGGYGSYNGARGPVSASVSSTTDGSRQWSLGSSGGMVLHAGGLTFADKSINDNDTLALIKAPGAEGSKVTTGENEIDSNGYAIATNLNPFHLNHVDLDISTQTKDVEITSTSATTAPHSGAIAQVSFETIQGDSYLMDLQRSDNGFIPLGADIYNAAGDWVGSVGQAGQAYARNIKNQETLHVTWGDAQNQSCLVKVNFNNTGADQKVALSTQLPPQPCSMTSSSTLKIMK